ncbi:hypothetical protein [Kribbella sp. VKM Ac-2566]|uniref:hypothetical protein n=1 Tax=Kribbella sp. VKM Ac-2566 TaxID=2512218 RepID=UPI001416F4C9|nr:hypothetical protein [Kribbella sp. VKM Ac-2566]
MIVAAGLHLVGETGRFAEAHELGAARRIVEGQLLESVAETECSERPNNSPWHRCHW